MKRYLVLENGEVFAGLALGAPCDTFGELVFTTGMNGYIETLTDPSYCGQIVLQTFPLIGNYGIIPADFEGKCCVRGYVVREACSTPSNFRCAQTLDAFLKENNIPGITGIDTRAVTRILREAGTMNAAICDAAPEDLAEATRALARTLAGKLGPVVAIGKRAFYDQAEMRLADAYAHPRQEQHGETRRHAA